MMARITLATVADELGLSVSANDSQISGVSIDSRTVKPGEIFIALQGSHVDGHAYVANAATKGAIAAVVEQLQDTEIQQLVVNDAEQALACIARMNRKLFSGKVVAITGSAGKTTCKNMVTAIAAQCANVCATRGNLNNELGVPLTLQRLNEDHQIAVLELGAAKLGDIRYLAEIVQPDVALITNVSEAHLAGFGSLDNTAKGKGEIYSALTDNAVAVINLDDRYAAQWLTQIERSQAAIQTITFSAHNTQANILLRDLLVSENGSQFVAEINWHTRLCKLNITLPLLGSHNAMNALAAIAVATALQISAEHIVAGLGELKPEPGRLCLTAAANDLLLIDDSYNANPQSMRAAIDVLTRFGETGKETIFVAGDMAELGADSADMHAEIGRYAAQCGINILLAIGSNAALYKKGFASIAAPDAVKTAESIDAAADMLLSASYAGATVLVKGSRVAMLDKLVGALKAPKERVQC